MPGSTPPTSQLDWLISMTAMIVLFWSRATSDLLKSFGWGIGALHRLDAATKLPFPCRPPHSISRPGWQMGVDSDGGLTFESRLRNGILCGLRAGGTWIRTIGTP